MKVNQEMDGFFRSHESVPQNSSFSPNIWLLLGSRS